VNEPGRLSLLLSNCLMRSTAALRSEWAALLAVEDQREQRKKLESYLDRAAATVILRRPELAKLVEGALRFHHGKLYDLRAWV